MRQQVPIKWVDKESLSRAIISTSGLIRRLLPTHTICRITSNQPLLEVVSIQLYRTQCGIRLPLNQLARDSQLHIHMTLAQQTLLSFQLLVRTTIWAISRRSFNVRTSTVSRGSRAITRRRRKGEIAPPNLAMDFIRRPLRVKENSKMLIIISSTSNYWPNRQASLITHTSIRVVSSKRAIKPKWSKIQARYFVVQLINPIFMELQTQSTLLSSRSTKRALIKLTRLAISSTKICKEPWNLQKESAKWKSSSRKIRPSTDKRSVRRTLESSSQRKERISSHHSLTKVTLGT